MKPKFGATGEYPAGSLGPDDEGEIQIGVASDSKGNVVVNFGKMVSWFAMPSENAIGFARLILRKRHWLRMPDPETRWCEKNRDRAMTIEEIGTGHPDFTRIINALNNGICPDCKGKKMIPGPRGGLSRNIHCDGCGSRFNVGPWYNHLVPHDFIFVQRIGQ